MKHYGLPKGTVSLVHELDVGQHLLVMMSDGSIDLLIHEKEPTPASTGSGIHLDAEETYRLFISLHEQFLHQGNQKLTCGDSDRTSEWSTIQTT